MFTYFSNTQAACKTADACLTTTVTNYDTTKYLITDADLRIKITLPSVHLITGVWWQADYRPSYDSATGYIVRILRVKYNIPSGLGVSDSTGQDTSWMSSSSNRGYTWDDSYDTNWKKAGKELRREITHLPKPLYTDMIILSNFLFSAEPGPNNDHIKSKLGFDIKAQIELYGCSNYDLDRSKHWFFG